MLACFLGRMLDRPGYEAVDIFGISWRGGIALQVAFQLPRRCRRLVLVITARIRARMLANSTLHVHHDGHLGLISQAHELAPVVTDFLLS